MRSKVLINPQRRRRIPKHFSWLDHRLVRNNHLKQCSTDALALYLFLVTVGDCEGLSYYHDDSIKKYLTFSPSSSVNSCREELIRVGLVAFRDGLYQVLGLAEEPRSIKEQSVGTHSISEMLEKMFGGK